MQDTWYTVCHIGHTDNDLEEGQRVSGAGAGGHRRAAVGFSGESVCGGSTSLFFWRLLLGTVAEDTGDALMELALVTSCHSVLIVLLTVHCV